MTENDAIKILAMIEANWQPVRNQQAAIELWASCFRDDPVELVETAVLTVIQTSDIAFRPTVGMIRRKMRDIIHGEMMSESEAWQTIKSVLPKAQESPETLKGAREAWNLLSEDLKKLVTPKQLLDWNSVEPESLDTVIQSNFMRSYREIRERKYAKEAVMKSTSDDIQAIRLALGKYQNPEAKPELPLPKKLDYEKPEWMLKREQVKEIDPRVLCITKQKKEERKDESA